MKLAFVDNLPVGGGLSRFSLLLCKSLVEGNHSLRIDYFVHSDNLKRIPEIQSLERVTIRVLQTTLPKSLSHRIIDKIADKLGRSDRQKDVVLEEIENRVNNDYDLAYFPSAHMMKRPQLSIPVVGTLHDFNWKYFFGQQIFGLPFVEMMDKEILNWMNNGVNICSSLDVVNEAKKLYPNVKNYPNVVHIAPVVFNDIISADKAAEIVTGLGIDYPYIIFPGNFYPHKNHLNLFTAFSFLKERKGFEKMKLVLTGLGTEKVSYAIAGKTGVEMVTKNSPRQDYNIRGMGYQSNLAIEALIKKAVLLVSPSIYEAICTPGMDAWHFGTPTAISDIPPFREHEQVWGIRSAFFDPMNPLDIANKIERYLENQAAAKEDGRISKENISKYSWNLVAEGYMNVFKQAINNK
jgi:glycosyltransferase involved in cell wall biosynthesis